MLSQADYDMLIGMPMTSSICAELGFINSAPIIESVLCYVQNPTGTKSDGGTIAAVRGLDDLINTSAYENTLLFDSASECIKVVESKKADLAAGNRSVMEYYIYDTSSTLVTSLIPRPDAERQHRCLARVRHRAALFAQQLHLQPDPAHACRLSEQRQPAQR